MRLTFGFCDDYRPRRAWLAWPAVSARRRRPDLLSPCRGDLRPARAAFDRKPRLWPDCRFVARAVVTPPVPLPEFSGEAEPSGRTRSTLSPARGSGPPLTEQRAGVGASALVPATCKRLLVLRASSDGGDSRPNRGMSRRDCVSGPPRFARVGR